VCVHTLGTLSVYCCLGGFYTGTLHNIVLQVVPVNNCSYEKRLFIIGRLTIVHFETSTVVMCISRYKVCVFKVTQVTSTDFMRVSYWC
jgi:hypothetical protein